MRMVGGGGAKPGACLGKGFHRNDACGRPFDRLRASGIANRPYDGVGGVGARVSQSWAVVGQSPPLPRGSCGPSFTLRFPSGRTASPAPPLWIPAFAGTAVGSVRAGECCWLRRGSRSGGTGASRIAPTVGQGESGMRRGLGVGVPCPLAFLACRKAGTGCLPNFD